MASRKKSPEKRPKAKSAPKRSEPKEKVEHFPASMRCDLSEREIVERSKRVSRLLSDKALKQEEIKGTTQHLKASVKQIDAEISKLSQEINDSACYREVQCERRFIYRTGKVVEVRMDTGAQTYERPMSGSERQLPLPKGKPDTSQAKANLAAALGHPIVEEDEEAPEVPGTDEMDTRSGQPEPEQDDVDDQDPPESEPEPEDDEDDEQPGDAAE
jgi:hypothetical protein